MAATFVLRDIGLSIPGGITASEALNVFLRAPQCASIATAMPPTVVYIQARIPVMPCVR